MSGAVRHDPQGTTGAQTRPETVRVRQLAGRPYESVFRRMQQFTASRTSTTPDEIWLVEHEPVFTLGQAAARSHILDAHDIPVVQTDRGGEVTYHGPGQAVVYLLVDLRRRFNRLYVRDLVYRMESAVIAVLAESGIAGKRRPGAPGVYVLSSPGTDQVAKIAALGLKVRGNGCTYHGLALNVAMDLAPFGWIDPCGYAGLAVTDMKSLGVFSDVKAIQEALVKALSCTLGFETEFVGEGESDVG